MTLRIELFGTRRCGAVMAIAGFGAGAATGAGAAATGAAAAGAAATGRGAGWTAPGWKASISALTIRPPGPLPLTLARSMPACWAMRFASGDTKMRSPDAAGAGIAGAGANAATGAATGIAAAAGAGFDAGAAPDGTASPASISTAIGSFTFTPSVPSATRIFPSTPSSTASTSIVALSVSISAMMSPAFTGSPSFFNQRASVPSVMVGLSAGIRMFVAMFRAPVQTILRTASTTHSGVGSASFSRLAA